MGISGNFFEIFDPIDFKIIAIKGRKQHFWELCMAGLVAFDSRLCHTLEVHKAKLLEIYNVWHVRYLWKNSKK
jgi:hypothetical protein